MRNFFALSSKYAQFTVRYFEQTDAQDKLEYQPCRREGMFVEQEPVLKAQSDARVL